MAEPFGGPKAFTPHRLQEEPAGIVAQSTVATVFVTHELDEAVFVSDRIVALVTASGTVEAIVDVHPPRPRRRPDGLLKNARATELRDHILRLVIED